MANTQLVKDRRVGDWLSRVDARLRLSRAGLGAGVLVGAVYTAQSAPHMTVHDPEDLLIVGAMLALIGGCLGWLAGELVRRPLSKEPG